MVRGFLEGLVDVAGPGFAGERPGDDRAAGDEVAGLLADDAGDRQGAVARRGARLHLAVDAFDGGGAVDHAAQVLAGLVDEAEVVVQDRHGRVLQVRHRERDQALGAAHQLVARHGAAVGIEPAPPEARDLVGEMTGVHALPLGQHQVGLQRLVGILDVGRRGFGIARRHGRRRAGRGGGSARARGGRRHGVARQRLQLARVLVHFAEVTLERLCHRFEHHATNALEVLLAELAIDLVAFVEPEAQQGRPTVAPCRKLFDAVLQQFERLQARREVDAVVLQANRLLQIGPHARHQLPVACVRPAPEREQKGQCGDSADEAEAPGPELGSTRVLANEIAVGEDDAREEFLEEEAVLARHDGAGAAGPGGQGELVGDAVARLAGRFADLHRAREIEAAEHRPVLVGVLFEQRRDEGPQHRLGGGEFEREREHARRQRLAPVERHLRERQFLQAVLQLVEVPVELLDRVGRLVGAVGQGRAPDLLALLRVLVGEELAETRDQVGLGEQHVDRREDLERLGQLLHALAQGLGQADRRVGPGLGQLGDARRDEDAVDRRLATVLLQKPQETEPLGAVFLLHRIASRGVDEDAVAAEEPVAIAGAADALDDVVGAARERKAQARLHDGRALARRRIADDHVPRQLVERGPAGAFAELGGLDRLDRLLQSDLQRLDLPTVARWRAGGRLHEVAVELLLESSRRATRSNVAHRPHGEPDAAGNGECDGGVDEADLQHVGAEEQEGGERGEPQHAEYTGVDQQTECAVH